MLFAEFLQVIRLISNHKYKKIVRKQTLILGTYFIIDLVDGNILSCISTIFLATLIL